MTEAHRINYKSLARTARRVLTSGARTLSPQLFRSLAPQRLNYASLTVNRQEYSNAPIVIRARIRAPQPSPHCAHARALRASHARR